MQIGAGSWVSSLADAPPQFALKTARIKNKDDLQDISEIIAERR
jgi:hypothetical protein